MQFKNQSLADLRRKGATAATAAKAAVKEVQKQSIDALARSTEKLRSAQPEKARAAEQVGSTLVDKSRSAFSGVAARRRQAELRAADSHGGALVGKAVRRGGAVLAQMPLLSLVPDVLNEKNGVGDLARKARDNPADMYAHLWLGEALRAQERDARLYALARSAATLDPALLLGREALKSAARLASNSTHSPAERNLRKAHYIAAKRIERNVNDADAYHVIARYYLATGKPNGGVEAAKQAVARAPADLRGQALVTLARTYLATGLPSAAGVAAGGAVACGCSLGYELLADLAFHEGPQATARDRMRTFGDLRSRVRPEDRVAYYGAYRTMSMTARGVAASQILKTKQQWARSRALGKPAAERARQTSREASQPAVMTPPERAETSPDRLDPGSSL